MHEQDDTIAAIATAPGEGGVAIVRISGPRCFAIADSLFKCRAPPPSQRAAFTFVPGHVVDADGVVIDEALLLVMRAPHSYTKEDVVELQGHGGPVVARRILARALDAGARLAEPGEFTKRAFLHGRIDLLQAEGVLDLIRARSDRAAAAAVEQLEGRLSGQIEGNYNLLVRVAASIEASLDFPDEELPTTILDGVAADLGAAEDRLAELLKTWNTGHFLRDGISIVIVGRPNVGKSTLLNALLGKDRAIVSDMPGTTRDIIEEGMVLGGYPIKLIDTAGLRDAACDVERDGIRRTEAQLARADICLYVVDASQPITEEDESRINTSDMAKTIVVLNKSDLVSPGSVDAKHSCATCNTSAKTGLGLHELRQAMVRIVEGHSASSVQHATISERHRQLLSRCLDMVRDAVTHLSDPDRSGLDLAAGSLRGAIEQLGLVTGRVYHEDLLDSIFSRFCIGK